MLMLLMNAGEKYKSIEMVTEEILLTIIFNSESHRYVN